MNDDQATPQPLKNRVILVTGAGQGIGWEAALSFASQGATIILLGRKQAKLEAAYDEILAAGYPEPLIFPLDLAKATEQDFANMAEGIYQQLGRLDGILHNATQFDNLSPLEIQTMAQFETMLRVNVSAPFALTKACLPLLVKSEDAAIILTSTSAGHRAAAYWGAHAVSKSAAEHMVKIWAIELEKAPNIRINTVIPGAVQSPQRKKTHPGELHEKLPLAASIMPIYQYLIGPESKGITGQLFEAQAQKSAATQAIA